MALVSYLLVAYKSNDTIAAGITSIQQQSGNFEREIILVDNYSADNCCRIVTSLSPQAKIIVNSENKGYTQAVNQAIAAATGDYLFFLNPDVELTPDCTRLLISDLESDPPVSAVAPQLLHRDGSIQFSVRNFPAFSTLIYEHCGLSRLFRRNPRFGRWKNLYFDHQTRAYVEQPMSSALLMRRSTQQELGAWDELFFIFFSDVDICKRLIDSGHRILFDPDARAYHAVAGSTRKERGWIVFSSHRSFYRYLSKHELRGSKAALRPVAAAILSLSAILRAIYREAISITAS